MGASALFPLFAFSCLSACAIASPLSYQSPSSLLNTLNSANNIYSFNVPPQANITVPASDVWPYPTPPNPFRYRAPNTAVAVEFSQHPLAPSGLAQQDILNVVNYAFFDCASQPPGDAVPLNPQYWTSGQVRLGMTPRNARPRSQDPRLTYLDWFDALGAIQGFVEHYQGKSFLFNVYGVDQDYSLAVGSLHKLVRPPTESS